MSDPELRFVSEEAVDFAFGASAGESEPSSPEEAWLRLAVVFLKSSGRVSLRSPVLPSVAVMPTAMLHALAADPNDWLQEALLRQKLEVLDSLCVVRHRLHSHARGAWIPGEQTLEAPWEAPWEAPSPQSESSSARHAQSSFWSLQLIAKSPLLIIARATTSGLIQLLAAEAAPGPAFNHKKIVASVLEEIDLMCSAASLRVISLSKEAPSFLAHTNSLVAVVDIGWARQDFGALLPSTITTLAEIRSQDAAEFAGLQFSDGRAFLLRIERRASRSSMSLQVLDLPVRHAQGADREQRESASGLLKRLLLAPIPRGLDRREEKAEDAAREARAVALLQEQLCSLLPRRDLLRHLAERPLASPEAEALAKEHPALAARALQGAERCAALAERQKALARRQQRLAEALQSELEAVQGCHTNVMVRIFKH